MRPASSSLSLTHRLGAVAVFIVALLTYWLTVEPTISYWDCPEYIASAMCLEPGHPPGNPLHMLATRVVTLMVPVKYAPLAANMLSGLFAAFGALLMYLVVYRFARCLGAVTETVAIGAATTAALCMAWMDTYWYSAVEAEVYAGAAFFSLLLLWLMLRRGDVATRPEGGRILLLVCYLGGLSFGMHHLTLLVLPALALIYAFTDKRVNAWLAFGVSFLILAFLLFCWIPLLLWFMGRAELLTVNGLGWDFHWGAATALVLLLALLAIAGLWVGRFRLWAWGLLLFTIGLSIFAIIPIRGYANPPMNQGAPGDVLAMTSYLGREQYGSSPLFYGRTPFSRPLLVEEMKDGQPLYRRYHRDAKRTHYVRRGGVYIPSDTLYEYRYTPELDMVLPRIWSSDPADIISYGDWVGLDKERLPQREVSFALDSLGNPVGRMDASGERKMKMEACPTYLQNLAFFASYQAGYMYFRYFMWNFVGRQNDRPSQGQADCGNFITGIAAIDDAMLGNDSGLPPEIGSENPGRNRYFALPLILGILGIVCQFRSGRRGARQFAVVLTYFIMTGLAIVVYLNQTPGEPRERDYAFVSSFCAFCIWLGLGIVALYRLCGKGRTGTIIALAAGAITALLLLVVNWDDHDRSRRRLTYDYALNALESAPPDAIILAEGDNSLFPLWYLTEAEGIRPDLRVLSISYLATPWYLRQLELPQRTAAPVPMVGNPSDLARPEFASIAFCATNPDTLDALTELQRLHVNPSKGLSSSLLRLPDGLVVDLRTVTNGNHLSRKELALLEILVASSRDGWARPLLWSPGVSSNRMLGLKGKSSLLGRWRTLAPTANLDSLNCHLLANRFRFTTQDAYIESVGGEQTNDHRRLFVVTAQGLMLQGDTVSALTLLRQMERALPPSLWPYETILYDEGRFNAAVEAGKIYLSVDSTRRHGERLINDAKLRNRAYLRYYQGLPTRMQSLTSSRVRTEVASRAYIDSAFLTR